MLMHASDTADGPRQRGIYSYSGQGRGDNCDMSEEGQI